MGPAEDGEEGNGGSSSRCAPDEAGSSSFPGYPGYPPSFDGGKYPPQHFPGNPYMPYGQFGFPPGAPPYGYGPPGRGWYGYNPEGPSYGPSGSRSTRGRYQKIPYSPSSRGKGPEKLIETGGTQKVDDLQANQAKNAEAGELSVADVKPMKTDYHFFVDDMKEKLRIDAEQEVRETNGGRLDSYLVNTNLNYRLKRAWEDLEDAQRKKYYEREEDDRKRFMEDDEVASRHCFTLTARLRTKEEVTAAAEKAASTNTASSQAVPKSESTTSGHETEAKRPPDTEVNDDESPSKKNRTEGE